MSWPHFPEEEAEAQEVVPQISPCPPHPCPPPDTSVLSSELGQPLPIHPRGC